MLSPAVVQAATTHPVPGLPGYGLFGWWGNVDNFGNKVSQSLPGDAYYALGAEHQVALVIPSLNMIMVRNGGPFDSGSFNISPTSNFVLALENYLFAPLMAAVVQATATTNPATSINATATGGGVAPYHPSPAIKGIAWAPIPEIIQGTGKR